MKNLDLVIHYIADNHLKRLSYNYLTEVFDYQVNSLDTKHFPKREVQYLTSLSVSTSRLESSSGKTDSSNTDLGLSYFGTFLTNRFYTFRGSVCHYFYPWREADMVGGDILLLQVLIQFQHRTIFIFLAELNQLIKGQFLWLVSIQMKFL